MQLTLRPNKKYRVKVKCKSKDLCKWELYASRDGDSGDFMVNDYHLWHKCTNKNKNKFCTSKYTEA